VDSHAQGTPDPGAGPEPRHRPRRVRILVLAAAILVLGVIAVVAPVLSILNAAPTTTFAGGERATVTLDAADEPRIYVSAAQPGRAECAVLDGPSQDGLSLSTATEEPAIEVGGISWNPMFDVHVSVPGEYQVTCVYEGEATFGLGTPPGIASSDAFRWPVYAAVGGMAAVIGGMLRKRRSGR